MKTLVIATITTAFLTGCATNSYELYAETQKAIAVAEMEAQIARANALKEIAASGDSAAKVAAVMSLQFSAQSTKQQVQAPTSTGDTALRWASILVPSITNIYGIGKNAELAIVNSNNNKEISINNNDMVVDLVKGRKEPIIGDDGDVLLYPTN
jgi:hypothetical protein